MQAITKTLRAVGRQNFQHPHDDNGGKIMPSLVVCDGVYRVNGDILLKANSYLRCIWVH